jgi:hypothetical protein
MLPWVLAAAAAVVAAVALAAWSGARARARRLAGEVREGIEPYLRRKAAEASLPVATPTWTARATPEQIVGFSGRLARQLNEVERLGPTPVTTRELAVAETQPVDDYVITGKRSG